MNANLFKTAAIVTFLLTGMAAATAAQAGDMHTLHHAVFAGSTVNWPRPTGAGSPVPPGSSINPAHGGSGFLGTPTTAFDKIRFTCPPGTNSVELNVRMKNQTALLPYRGVQAMFVPPLPNPPYSFIPTGVSTRKDYYAFSTDAARWNQPAPNSPDPGSTTISVPTPAGQQHYDIKVDKIGGGLGESRRYELNVACFSGENETGTLSWPISAIYLTNQ